MPAPVVFRPLQHQDRAAWAPLWDGYNAFYGREGPTALDPAEPISALVAEADGQLLGLTHYLYHRSTNRLELTCYLQDRLTTPAARGHAVGQPLIQGHDM